MTTARIILAAAIVLLAACGGESRESAPPLGSAPGGVETDRVGQAGVSVALPPQWHATTPNDGPVVDPLARVVVASSPIQPKESACQVSAYEFAADAVALVILEWTEPQALLPERPGRFTSRELSVLPPPAIECFDGPGGSVQFVDHGRTSGAYLLVGPDAPESLVVEARRVLDTLHVEPPAVRRLERNGVSLAVPRGWDGRLLFRDRAGSWGVVFQAANFELPPNEGFDPPQQLPPGQEEPIKAMDGGDVLVTVISDEADGESAPATIALDGLRFLPADAPRVPRGHTLAERSFCFESRCLRIGVDFGGRAPAPTHRRKVNYILASIAVERSASSADANSDDDGPRGCPRPHWPGPWTACAEADWVRRVVEAGGYRVGGETSSALVAAGKGRSFYIGTTRAKRSPEAIASEAGNWRRLTVIDGVAVYGDDELWRFWEAQGLVYWVNKGPRGDSIAPSPAELGGLLEASQQNPPAAAH